MPSHFGKMEFGEGDRWSPDYDGIDWRALDDRLVDEGELEPYEPVGFDSGDGYTTECHQENLAFRTNKVAPYMDMVAQGDERDGKDYIWFREDSPERFESLLEKMGHAALLMHSRYPLSDTVRIYLDRRETGIDMQFLNPEDSDEH